MRMCHTVPILLTAFLGNLALAAPTSGAAPLQSLSPGAARAVKTAQVAIKKHHWREAEKALDAADSSQASSWDEFRCDELKAYVLYRAHQDGAAARTYARLLRSKYGSVAKRHSRTKLVAELYFRAGEFRQAVHFGERYLKAYADDPTIAALVADAQLRLKDYERSAATMSTAVEHVEADHKVPDESWLRIADNAYYRLGNTSGEVAMLQKLVRYYERPEDWKALLALSGRGQRNERLEFGYLRLKYDLGMLSGPGEYETLIFEAMEQRMPDKARAVLTRAKEQGVFSEDRCERLNHALNQRRSDVQVRLQHVINRARRDTTGESDALAAKIYFGEGAYGPAIAAAQRALNKGSLKDPDAVRVDLGVAFLRNHEPHLAEAAFQAVSEQSHWADLAALWKLRAESPPTISVEPAATAEQQSLADAGLHHPL